MRLITNFDNHQIYLYNNDAINIFNNVTQHIN